MNSTLHTLRDWSEQGWLRRLDSALADFHASLATLPDASQAAAADQQVRTLLQGRAAIDSRSLPAGQMFTT